MMQQKTINLLGAVCGIGAENTGCSLGPIILQGSKLFTGLPLDFYWQAMLYVQDSPPKLAATHVIADLCERLAQEVCALVLNKSCAVTIGGDHSCSIGTWSGAAAAIKKHGALGLIWVDAHMDSHTHESSESKNIHGMPLAALLGYGHEELTHIMYAQPKLKPEHICLIGVRSYEQAELELLQELGVRIFFMEEVQQKGMQAVMSEALTRVNNGTIGYGISIDLNSIDPHDAPGVESPAPDGIKANDFLAALTLLHNDPKLLAAEIVEFNPNLDETNKTEQLICNILKTLYL